MSVFYSELVMASSPPRGDVEVGKIALDRFRSVPDGSGAVAPLGPDAPLVLLFKRNLRVDVGCTCTFCKIEKLILDTDSIRGRQL